MNNDDVCVAVAQGANVVLYKLVSDKEHPEIPRSLVQQRCQLQNEAAADAVAASINRDLGRKRCMLVLANPLSGRGRSLEIWNSTVKPLLDSAGISSRFHQTRARNDARTIVSGLAAPVPFSAILCIGGDGLLCEVINGLMDRDDWQHAVQGVQLVPVAAGTGNALAKTLYNSTEPAVAVCHAIKCAAAKHVDAFLALQSPKDAPKWGCMGVSAGILADADLDSERLRWLGSARFFASGTFHVLAGPRVRCKLTAIVPTEQPSPVSASMAAGCPFKFRELFSAAVQGSEAVVHIDSPFIVLANTPFISADLNAAPRAHISDGHFDILYSSSSEMSRWGCAWMLVFGFGNGGNHIQDSRIRLLRASAFTLEVLGPSPRIAVDGEAVSSAPVTVLVAPPALRTEVTVKGLTTTPALLATFGFRITGNATISAAAAESADLSAVNVTLCTAAQLKTISASGDALSARRLRDTCEWTGGLGATHVVQHTAEYAAYAWLSSSLGSAVDATLHVLLLNPSARYAQLPLGDAPLPVAALVLVAIWGAAAAAWGAVCAWARRHVAGPHVFVLAMLGGKAVHMALAAAFWAHYAASGLRDTALHTIVLLLEAVCETGLFALLLVLAEGWRIVTPASSHASWHRMRSAFLMLLMLLASLVINAFWNGAYSMLTVIVVYFFLLPRAFAAVARSLRLLFTYRALFAALGLRTRQLRVKLRAMRSIRGMVVFYLVATLLALAFDVMLPFFVSPWVGVIFRESARIIVVVALAVIINPIDRPVVLADVNHLEHIDELPVAMAARAGGARAAAAAAEDAGRARFEAYAERVEKGDVVVFELPPIPGQQGPRLALGTRRSNPAEDGSTTPRALTDAASTSKSSEALKSSPS